MIVKKFWKVLYIYTERYSSSQFLLLNRGVRSIAWYLMRSLKGGNSNRAWAIFVTANSRNLLRGKISKLNWFCITSCYRAHINEIWNSLLIGSPNSQLILKMLVSVLETSWLAILIIFIISSLVKYRIAKVLTRSLNFFLFAELKFHLMGKKWGCYRYWKNTTVEFPTVLEEAFKRVFNQWKTRWNKTV